MSAIDIHTHAFPDDLAERAVSALEADADWQAVADGTVDALVASMDDADIDVACVCSIATKPEQVKAIFKWSKKMRSDRLEPLPSVHPRTPKAHRWPAKFAKAGFAGIKMHPMFQDFLADDTAMDALWQAAIDAGLFVVLHCRYDVSFPGDERASPIRVRRLIDRHPDLKLVLTHLGGWRAWDQAERHLLQTPAFMGTSYSLAELGPQRSADLIRRHGPDRVLFGSDWPWRSQKDELRLVRQLPLTSREKKGILWANAAGLLGY